MANDEHDYIVTELLEDGETATFQLVPDADGGRLFLWLDPGLHPDEVVTFYRVTERGAKPVESWQNFQQGDSIAGYAGEQLAPLGAVEQLDAGQYTIDARIFTGFDTVGIPGIDIDMQPVSEDADTAAARAAFEKEFMALFAKFFAQADTANDARAFFDAFNANQLDFLVDAVVELGAPEDFVGDDETKDIKGFFEFIDYVTTLFHAGGDAALARLARQPDSPTNRHYIHWIKQLLANDRLLGDVLAKYSYCRGD